MWVKICGVTRPEDARVAVRAGADAIGVNFSPASPRCASFEQAAAVVASVPADFMVYGVFVRAGRKAISETVARTGIRGIQLHGGEADEEVEGWDLPVLRAVAATSAEIVRQALARARGYRVLVDSAAGGGSGHRVSAQALQGVDLTHAVLAGGLTPANVAEAVAERRPWGVDTASGVERAPGIKDSGLIEEFVRHAHTA